MRRDELTLPENPQRDRPNDRWICGRTCSQSCAGNHEQGDENAGGESAGEMPQCVHGPSRFGKCPVSPACRPRRTWAGWRRIIAVSVLLFLCGGLLLLSVANHSPSVFKPGELTSPHAQILQGTLTADRCAACHEPSALSMTQWLSSAGADHAEISQTDRCMDCHHSTMDRDLATHAHNIPVIQRQNRTERIRLAAFGSTAAESHSRWTKTSLDQDDVQCSVCHKEHRGADADLLTLSDAQCQTCHTREFGHFVDEHPDWKQWPYGRGGEIAFDHSTHAGKHFPATLVDGSAQTFDCGKCHPSQSQTSSAILGVNRALGGELVRTASYERACAQCHDASLQLQTASGIELVSLPIVPRRVADQVDGWPESATGFYDGRLSPLTQLLLRGDDATQRAIRNVPDADFSRLHSTRGATVANALDKSAATIIRGMKTMMADISIHGPAAWSARLQDGDAAPATMTPVVRSLPPQFVHAVYRQWFQAEPKPQRREAAATEPASVIRRVHWQSDDLLLGNEPTDVLFAPADTLLSGGLADGLESSDALDPLAPLELETKVDRAKRRPQDLVSAGGWYHDDIRMSIQYRSTEHADPVLVAWIETLSLLSRSDPVREQAVKQPAVAACIACHPVALSMPGRWRAENLVGKKNEFTKFAHRPHLNVSALGDCVHCHVIGHDNGLIKDTAMTTSEVTVTRSLPGSDFHPLTKQACAACHQPNSAGDNCVTCHRYHIDMR